MAAPVREVASCDVLVVGLGPVGAALAALLAARGVRVIAIDRDTAVYPLPRAAHFDHEIMRLFQELGVAETVSRDARPAPAYEFRSARRELLMRIESAPETPSGWASGYMFHQPSLEHALRARLAAAPEVEMRLGCAFLGLEQDADGVTVDLRGPDGEARVRARYVVGCDGGRSAVREAIGVGLSDLRFDEPWLVLDVRVTPEARVPDVNLQLCDPARPTTCVLMGPGRHRWEFMLLPGETAEDVLDDAVIQRLLAPWDCGPVEIERKAVYRFHGLVAERWRSGRVLLAGDSAHQTPPFAGQGMCSGLRDAANLGWKLAAVLRQGASPDLLDTYQPEREPNVRALIAFAIGMGRVVCTRDPVAAAERDRAMLAQMAAGETAVPPPLATALEAGCLLAGSPGAGTLFPQATVGTGAARKRLDDALGDGPWLIGRAPGGAVAGVAVHHVDEPALGPFRAALIDWLDRHGAEAVLVRPDRFVFGAGPAPALAQAWADALGTARALA
jgi:3-(3-hydroxy-phenyl)propionate hydroxylase